MYDASYVALAQVQGVPLVTADMKLIRKCARLGDRVLPLGSTEY